MLRYTNNMAGKACHAAASATQAGLTQVLAQEDLSVWKQQGRISLWRYTENERNYPGWHLNADPAGCTSLLALLEELAQNPGAHRTVQLSAPSPSQLQVPNNRGGRAAWSAPAKLSLACSAQPGSWEFPPDLEPASLTIGSDWLEPLRTGIAGIPEGRGDYSIGHRKNGNLSLWFWW